MKLNIVFQNEHLIAVDKPWDTLSIPGRMIDERPILGREIQNHLNRQVYPVHRLDFGVSGLIFYALSSESHRVLSDIFEQRGVQKTYEAVAPLPAGAPDGGRMISPGDQGSLKIKLLRGKKRAYESAHGKLAITHYEVGPECFVSSETQVYLWKLNPVTGRSHQLRYTLFHLGAPIVGDDLYGSRLPWPQGGIALRSVSLNFLCRTEIEKVSLDSNANTDIKPQMSPKLIERFFALDIPERISVPGFF